MYLVPGVRTAIFTYSGGPIRTGGNDQRVGSAWDPVGIPEGSDAFLGDPGFRGPIFVGDPVNELSSYIILIRNKDVNGAFWAGIRMYTCGQWLGAWLVAKWYRPMNQT